MLEMWLRSGTTVSLPETPRSLHHTPGSLLFSVSKITKNNFKVSSEDASVQAKEQVEFIRIRARTISAIFRYDSVVASSSTYCEASFYTLRKTSPFKLLQLLFCKGCLLDRSHDKGPVTAS